MDVALAELPPSALTDICVQRPQVSARPLEPSEYYPPGTSRISKTRTSGDADNIYSTTVGQRAHVLQQLEEAERNAQDALFALETIDMELSRESAAIKSVLSHLSETLPPHEFENLCNFAFGQSKKDWESVWKCEWVEDVTERNRHTTHPSCSSKEFRSNPSLTLHAPSSPLPPSSPPPPTSPSNMQDTFPACTSHVRVGDDESQLPTRPPSPPTLDGFKTPQGFVDNFGSTRYRSTVPVGPSRPQQSRRLKRDERRLDTDRRGMPVFVHCTKEIEVQRRDIGERIRLQNRQKQKFPIEAENSLFKIVQGQPHHVQDPPVTWFRIFDEKEPSGPDDFKNPFSQDDHVSPTLPEQSPHLE